ncbi:BTAD domain-containing putative transcriptional regulator [Actinoplanes sp. CA-030573]|uniref:BTAD domain-containing putative transcriptional regulator n=1 Tax=Actinoplanes sp. CA-030573 TaxID=3239898 RepID=UPI003D8D2376
MRICLLGPVEAHDGDRAVRLTGAKQHALLALMALNAGRIVPADRLIDALWDEDGPRDLANALQHQVSRLRAALGGDVVTRRRAGYLLDVPPDAVDAIRFERLVAAGRPDAALGLWRGPPLDGLPGYAWVQAEQARLERLRLDAIEDHIDAGLALGRHHELVGELQTLVGEHPLRERLWGRLMLAQYRCGRQADALESFLAVRRVLADEHGLEPGAELRELQSAILAQSPSLTAGVEPAGNLPAPLSTFIGRHDEVVTLRGRVRDTRLLTLTGPPGVGKTRLAIEVAAGFPDGAWLVELAPLTDPGAVAGAVASALGIRVDLVTHLRERRALLVLDNCEHLLPEVAVLAGRLLAACPRLHVLATSREPLGIGGETSWPVRPLAGAEAVRLFEDRAAQVRPSFAVTPGSGPAVAELCRRLDGLPLAIELAAARVRAFPVAHIAAELADRFRFLVDRGHAAPPHRQTLRATLDWSYDLLGPGERVAFPLLSVFAGGFGLDAAAAVGRVAGIGSGEMAELVAGLVDKSLLTAEPDLDGRPRFGLLETLREYGRERLADPGPARAAHRDFYLAFAEEAESGLRRGGYRSWHRRVAADYDNLRVAAAADALAALRIGAALWLFWGAADRHAEGSAWLEGALSGADAVPAPPGAVVAVPAVVRAAAYTTLSYLAGQGGDVERAVRAGERAVALAAEAGDDWEGARAKQTLALVLGAAGEAERAATLLAEARAVMVATGDDFWVAASELIDAMDAVRSGMADAVGHKGRSILGRARRAGYEPFECWARLLLAAAAERQGDVAAAAGELAAALDVAGRIGLPHYLAFVRTELGRLAMGEGDLTRARALQEEAVAAAEAGDSPWHAALARCSLAETLRRAGEAEAALALFRTVRAWAESTEARHTRATFFTVLGGSPHARCLLGLGLLAAGPSEAEPLLFAALERAEHEHDHPAAADALTTLTGLVRDR